MLRLVRADVSCLVKHDDVSQRRLRGGTSADKRSFLPPEGTYSICFPNTLHYPGTIVPGLAWITNSMTSRGVPTNKAIHFWLTTLISYLRVCYVSYIWNNTSIYIYSNFKNLYPDARPCVLVFYTLKILIIMPYGSHCT